MKFTEEHTPKYSSHELSKFKFDDEFMDAAVELYKQSLELLIFYTDKKYHLDGSPIELSRDEAVVAGNFVRLQKLSTSFLQNVCELKFEIAVIINRSISETYINIKYFLETKNSNAINNYIKYSLIQEKEFYNTIQENIEKRNGEILPIEERMLKSIENSFEKSEKELGSINRSSKWQSIAARAKEINGGLFYTAYFGLPSHIVHGNWQDFITNHLEKTKNGYIVSPEWYFPRVQVVTSTALMNFDIIKSLCEKEITDSPIRNYLLDNHETLKMYLLNIIFEHEKHLNKEDSDN